MKVSLLIPVFKKIEERSMAKITGQNPHPKNLFVVGKGLKKAGNNRFVYHLDNSIQTTPTSHCARIITYSKV